MAGNVFRQLPGIRVDEGNYGCAKEQQPSPFDFLRSHVHRGVVDDSVTRLA